MLRTKMMLLIVVVVALAVPSLWAQDVKAPRQSVKDIQAELQSRATALHVPAACIAIGGGIGPQGYLPSTNKCSSSSPLYGFGNSLNTTVATCSDKGGVEGHWRQTNGMPLGLSVDQAGVDGSLFTAWGQATNVGGFEWMTPDIYSPAISPSPDIVLALKHPQALVGLEVSDLTESNYTVTFATTAGNVSATVLTGGVAPPDNGAQRFVAICNAAAITKVTIHCAACANAVTAVAQVRGDKFLGF